eukprot:7384328-Prymnesium_polylepis.1
MSASGAEGRSSTRALPASHACVCRRRRGCCVPAPRRGSNATALSRAWRGSTQKKPRRRGKEAR